MDNSNATSAFAALSQPIRLEVFRLLIQAGDTGLLAGEIGDTLDVRQNTMSTNLSILHRAGLIRNKREGRTIRYFANMSGIQSLLDFLLQDCCGGNPTLCKPFVEQLCVPKCCDN